MSFAGKSALVTGAAGGMGFAIAKDLLSAGAKVTLTDVASPGDQMARTLADFGAAADFIRGDITDEAFVAKVTKAAFESSGRLDHLVNAAGVLWFGRDKSLVEIPPRHDALLPRSHPLDEDHRAQKGGIRRFHGADLFDSSIARRRPTARRLSSRQGRGHRPIEIAGHSVRRR
jgi:NAD(P)-dependent dehydrogenase (short-subunit alcohol dehydrogenase family)